MTTLSGKPERIERLEPKERKGLILVITGHGKGKTTAALGMAVRACGHGMRVSIIQFMKGDLYAYRAPALYRLLIWSLMPFSYRP